MALVDPAQLQRCILENDCRCMSAASLRPCDVKKFSLARQQAHPANLVLNDLICISGTCASLCKCLQCNRALFKILICHDNAADVCCASGGDTAQHCSAIH